MTEVDLDGLHAFIASSEGSYPPVFVGREPELNTLMTAARETWHLFRTGQSGSLSKRTHIVHGAPGAGKSTLLWELDQRLHAVAPETGRPRLLYTNSAELEMDMNMVLERMEGLARLDADNWQQRLKTMASRVSGSINFGPFTTSLDPDDSLHGRPQTLGQLRERLPPDRWQTPVVLAIDEFQNIGSSEQSPVSRLLQALHEASCGLPVMLVLSGLGNSPDQARKIGLTRGLAVTGIGCLSEEEARALVRGWCRHYGLDTDEHGTEIDHFADSTGGWPRHLHFALQALAGELVRSDVDGQLSRVFWQGVMNGSMDLRRKYYYDQQSPEMQASAYLVAALMRDLQPERGPIGVDRLIHRHRRKDSGWRLPDGMSSWDFQSHLIHRGVLHPGDDSSLSCPIPSFRDFLIAQGEPAPAPAQEPDGASPQP